MQSIAKILEDMRPESVQLYCAYLAPNSFAQTAQSGPVSTRRMGNEIKARTNQDVDFPMVGTPDNCTEDQILYSGLPMQPVMCPSALGIVHLRL